MGEIMAVAKYKNVKPSETFTGADRIPPFLPINWVDWESDEHVQDMSESMEGVFFRILRVLWKYDTFLLDHNRLAERIRADRRNVKAFLEQWGHLFVCSKCGGTPLRGCGKLGVVVSQVCPHCAPSVSQVCSDSAPSVSQVCSDSAPSVSQVCSDSAPSSLRVCSCSAPTLFHEKLKNYKNDVKSGLPLGTTEPLPNLTEPEPNLNLTISSESGEGVEPSESTPTEEEDDDLV
jgi:hypothetical protein